MSEPVKVELMKLDPAERQKLIDDIAAAARAAEAFAERQGWITPTTGKVIMSVIAAMVLIAGSFWAGSATTKVGEPVPVPPPAVVVDLKPVTDAIKALDASADKRQVEVMAAIAAKPLPVPVPVDPDVKPIPPKLVIPAEIAAKVGRLVTIKCTVAVDQWVVPPGSPCEWEAHGAMLTLVPTEAVEFPIGVVTGGGKSLTWCLVKAGEGPRPPPGPGPIDPFVASLQAAYVADGKPTAALASLTAIYRQSGSTVSNPSLAKASDVLAAMHTAAQSLIGDQLMHTRRVLADDSNIHLGKTDKVLDAQMRAAIAAQFLHAQKSLEELK